MNHESNLTNNQFLIWLGQQIDPDLPLYNMVLSFSLSAEINVPVFQAAFQTLVGETDAMRLVVEEENGIPQQSIKSLQYQIEFLDFSEKNKSKAEFENWQVQRASKNFDLSHCLFDSALIKLAENHFVWYLNQHHLITDGWSSTVLYKRMSDLYQLALAGNLNQHSPYPPYKDYITYERDLRESPTYKQAKNYWSKKLSTPLVPTRFFSNPAKTSVKYKTAKTQRVTYVLNEQQVGALNALVNSQDVRAINIDLTKFSLFTGLLFTLVHCLNGERNELNRLRIGTPFHNRQTSVFKETVGLFIEMGVLQVDIQPQETFLSLVKQIQAESLAGLRYAQPGSSSAKTNSSYDVVLNYIHADYGDFAGIPIESEWIHPGYGDRHHNLRIQVHDHDQTGGFTLHFDLNTDIFDPQQQQRFVQYFVQTLDIFLADHTQTIQSIKDQLVPMRSDNSEPDKLAEPVSNDSTDIAPSVDMQASKTILLTNIWASVLNLDDVGLHDNLFDLGGDSITGIQIITKAAEMGLSLQPKHIFEHQTIAELSSVAQITKSALEQDGEEPSIQDTKSEKNKTGASDFPLADLDGESFDDLADVLDQLRDTK